MSSFAGLPGSTIRLFVITVAAVHVVRILVIPMVAWMIGNDEFTETERAVRVVGIKPVGPCSLSRRDPPGPCPVSERLHIVLVSAQWDREPITAVETEVIVKSMLHATRCKMTIHFMVTAEEEDLGIHAMMEALGAVPFDSEGPVAPELVRHDSHAMVDDVAHLTKVSSDPPIGYSIHPIPVEWVREQAGKLGINITHHAGEAGFAKLFLPEILWHIKRAIYLDVDMLLGGDIGDLWTYFKQMDTDKDLLLFMGDNHPTAFGPRARYPYCSCQLIMDLERFRQQNLTKLALESFGDQKPMDIWGYRPGDQWVFTMMCMNNPEKCGTLPKIWNLSGCAKPRFLGLNARDRDQNGTCWKAVHFNCMGVRANGYYALTNTDWEDTRKTVLAHSWPSLLAA